MTLGGDDEQAEALYEEALRRTPDFRPSRIRLAWIRAVGPEAERNPRQAHELALGLLGEAGERRGCDRIRSSDDVAT